MDRREWRGTVYLAGSMTGLTYKAAKGWRLQAAEYLNEHNIRTLSPMRGHSHVGPDDELDAYYEVEGLGGENAVVAADRSDVMRSDAVLFNFTGATRVSIGSIVEVAWADAWRKPAVAVIEDGSIHDHPFIRSLCQFRYRTLLEGLAAIERLLG